MLAKPGTYIKRYILREITENNTTEHPINTWTQSLQIICDFHNSGGKKESKAIPVTGREDPYGRETSRLPHFLDNRLTDGDSGCQPYTTFSIYNIFSQ
jgi:hypothetical protein